jgi:hypothetical protein
MNRRFLLLFLGCLLASGAAIAMPSRPAPAAASTLAQAFRAPWLAPVNAASLPAPLQKAASAPVSANAPRRVGSVRELAQPFALSAWAPVSGGFVARARVSSEGAIGLRVRLDLGVVPGEMEVRAQGTDGRIETMVLDPTRGPQAWTPWTAGPTQVLELFTPVLPGNDAAVTIGALVHFDAPVIAKSAGTCTLETMCAANDASLGPGIAGAIGQREKSVVRLSFVSGGSAFVCSGTLINTEKFPAPYVVTANHCIDSDAVARTVTAWWFYESDDACPDQGIPPIHMKTSDGMQLVFTNYNVDSTLLLMNQPPPTGAIYAGWNPARLSNGAPIVSLSHPEGDTARYAVGSISRSYRLSDWPQDFYGVRYSKGIIEGGSSGSGLFTVAADGSLELRGILTGTTVQNSSAGLSCTDLNEDGLYSRFEIFEPEIVPYITVAGKAADDAPNRPQDLFGVPIDPTGAETLNTRATPIALDDRHIDYPGDLDVYRVFLNAPAWVSLWTEGANLDTIGTLLDSTGVQVDWNDDAETSNNHFGITRQLTAGTYYLQVAHWDAAGTGAYNLRMRADTLDTNYTDLWWAGQAESGWGININHQGNVIFATLYTYDLDGSPMWLDMSDGERQADGSYTGALYRATGPAFDGSSAGPFSPVQVGTMRIAFTGPDSANLTYTYNGIAVAKSITRTPFAAQPAACSWSAFDRSFSDDYQDLWWNPNESGWGVNLAHQADTLFATLFTYDRSGKGLWLVMSDGARTGSGRYSGTLYRTSGPPFNASPWRSVSQTPVGTMSFAFSDGDTGTMTYTVNGTTVTKPIQRFSFQVLRPDCGS